MTMGLVGFVINAGLLLLIAWHRRARPGRLHGRRVPAEASAADTIVAAIIGAIVAQHRQLGRAAGRPRLSRGAADDPSTTRLRLAAAARRFGTPVFVTDSPRSTRRRRGLRGAFPDPWLRAVSRSRRTTSRRSSRRSRPRASARTSSRAASGDRPAGRHPERADHARGRSARPTRTCGPRSGPRPTGDRCAGSRSNRPTRPTALAAMARRAGLGRPADRASTSSSGSTRTSSPETHAGPGRRRGREQVRDDRDRAGGGHRGRRRSRTDRCLAARHPPPRRLAARAVDAWRDARPAGAGACWRCSAAACRRSTPSTSAAASRSAARRPSPAPARFAREVPALARRPCPPTADPRAWRSSPGGSSSRGAGWLVARVLHVRERGGRPGRPRRRDDRADPPRAVRRLPPDHGADLARAADRGRGARHGRTPTARASRARSASPPTPSASTTCRRSAAATSSRSPTPGRTPRRWRPPTTAGRGRRRCSSRRTARCSARLVAGGCGSHGRVRYRFGRDAAQRPRSASASAARARCSPTAAMGTLLFSRGIPQRACLDELVTDAARPGRRASTASTSTAGADLIETADVRRQPASASPRFGLADQAGRLNRRARPGRPGGPGRGRPGRLVGGSSGRWARRPTTSRHLGEAAIRAAFREQHRRPARGRRGPVHARDVLVARPSR